MVLFFHSGRSHNEIPVCWQVNLPHLNLPQPETKGWAIEDNCFVPKLSSLLPLPDACLKLTTCTLYFVGNITWWGRKPNPCTASCKYRKCNDTCMHQYLSSNIWRGFNHCINWSKASFDLSIADIREQNNILHICLLCCDNTSKHSRWHAKEGALR